MLYDDTIFSMSTLAHELGHSMHSYLTWKHQPAVYAQYSLFVAEVASNINQATLRAHLLKTNDDPQFQISCSRKPLPTSTAISSSCRSWHSSSWRCTNASSAGRA
jgi:oligoendopeptidase F